MFRTSIVFILASIGILVFSFAGCGKNTESPTTTGGSNPKKLHDDNHEQHNHGDHDDHSNKTDMEKMKKGLAKLSEEDRAAAMKQHICPVSGEMLGTMGTPSKVALDKQDVWICCDGCKKDLQADPDKYLAKLKK